MDDILSHSASDEELVEQLSKYGYKGANGIAGNNGVYPESVGQLEREEQNATASRNQRIHDLMGPSLSHSSITNNKDLQTSNNIIDNITTITTSNTVEQNDKINRLGLPSPSRPSPSSLTTNGHDMTKESPEALHTSVNETTDNNKNNNGIQSQSEKSDSILSSDKSDTIVQQTVTIGKDGKRRIKPVTIRTKSSVPPRPNSSAQNNSQSRVSKCIRPTLFDNRKRTVI